MKEIIAKMNKAFENRVRLGIMSALMVNEWVDFSSLKGWLEITDGNLASHIKMLEDKKLIRVRKQFVGRKPNTSYQTTELGRKLFREHLAALEQIIRNQ